MLKGEKTERKQRHTYIRDKTNTHMHTHASTHTHIHTRERERKMVVRGGVKSGWDGRG